MADKMGLTQKLGYDGHGNTVTYEATDGLIFRYEYDILDRLTYLDGGPG